MKIIKIDNEEYQLKSSFSEFTKREFLKVSFIRSQHMEEMSVGEYHAARIQMFTVISNVPMRIIEKIVAEQWADILPHVDFCFKAPDFKETPIKSYRRRCRTFHAPTGMLEKSSIGEMATADAYFIKASANSLDDFAMLAAILYRPKRRFLFFFKLSSKWNGDIREEFNMNRVKQRQKHFKKMPFHFLVSVFLYYQSFREHKLLTFTRLFPKNPTEGGLSITNRGWAGTILEIAHTSVFGTFKETSQENWLNVVTEMDMQIEIDIKRKEHLENLRLQNK